METPFELLEYVVEQIELLGISYALGGSIASMAYGEPRLTRDIDIVVDLKVSDIDRLIRVFPPADFYFDPITARAAVREGTEFNIIHPDSGVKIDVFIPADPFTRNQLQRVRRFRAFLTREADFSPPEELILKKLDYHRMGGSDKHLRDIAGMLQISPEQIDRAYVSREAARLGVSETWEAILRRVDSA